LAGIKKLTFVIFLHCFFIFCFPFPNLLFDFLVRFLGFRKKKKLSSVHCFDFVSWFFSLFHIHILYNLPFVYFLIFNKMRFPPFLSHTPSSHRNGVVLVVVFFRFFLIILVFVLLFF